MFRAMEPRDLAVSVASGRLAIGVASLLAPGLVARTMTGSERTGAGGTSPFARMVRAPDLGFGLGALIALDRGAPARGWLEASAPVDGVEAVVGLAPTGALLSAWLAGQLDDP
jgi:hypothetical protein